MLFLLKIIFNYVPAHIYIFIFLLFYIINVKAYFDNYNSILIGDKAAGMGGAFTSLSNDPSACAFYNPATLSLMKGSSLSASTSLFNKYDIAYDRTSDFIQAAHKSNQGIFKQIPTPGGFFSGFGPFTLGMTILNPTFKSYNGKIKSDENSTFYTNIYDNSLWVGGAIALNLSKNTSFGFTFYYTAREFTQNKISNNYDSSEIISTTENINLTNNSILYILGYYYKINPSWAFGTSVRFPSIEINGKGSYYRTSITSSTLEYQTISEEKLSSETKIPAKIALGISYSKEQLYTFSLDLHHYLEEEYRKINSSYSQDISQFQKTTNISLGAEFFLKTWLKLRTGIFTNFSSHPKINQNNPDQQNEHIDMWGFSANMAFFTSESVSFTFGGYYTGGKGYISEKINKKFIKIPKSKQIFSMLISSTYLF